MEMNADKRVEGTIKSNNQDVYITFEDTFAVLSNAAKDGDAAKAKARALAEQISNELKKDPSKFAELAKKYSQDPGSAAKGGDLGTFGRGSMVKSFDDAVFSMKPGEISAPVESEYGYHVIRVTAVNPAQMRSFNEARADIEKVLVNGFFPECERDAAPAAGRTSAWRPLVPMALLLASLAALVVALAKPERTVAEPVERATIMLVTDHSRSMESDDVQPGPAPPRKRRH